MGKNKATDDEPEADSRQEDDGVEPEEEKHSDTRIIMTLLLVVLILCGLTYLAYVKVIVPWKNPAPAEVTESYTYRHFVFQKVGNLWVTNVQIGSRLITIPLHNGPYDLTHNHMAGRLNDSFNDGPLYITFDPTEANLTYVGLSAAELSLNLAQGINRQIIAACTTNTTEACRTRPIVDCRTNGSVIYLLPAKVEHGYVELSSNCIVVAGQDEELLKAADLLLLYWYGIMPMDN